MGPFYYADQAALERPEFVVESAWLGHVPFARWLVARMRPARVVELGTHNGTSFLGFVQGARRAVEAGADPIELTAVDHWNGDEQAGFYGDAVYRHLKGQIDGLFEATPGVTVELWRRSFDDALPDVAEGSVDLLHIDGLHTYEAVAHDFRSWLPKLSERGLVLLHDTEVLFADFGVRRFFVEIARDFPTASFRHSHGLGIVKVGGSDEPWLDRLMRGAPDDAGLYPQQTFERLGEAVALQSHLGRAFERLDALDDLAQRLALMQRDQLTALGRGGDLVVNVPPPLVDPDTERAVLESGLFDVEHYTAQVGVPTRDRGAQLRHYVEWGEQAGLTPSKDFDPTSYREAYDDLTHAPMNMLIHFLQFGRNEGRLARPERPEQRIGDDEPKVAEMSAPASEREDAETEFEPKTKSPPKPAAKRKPDAGENDERVGDKAVETA